MSTPTPSHPQAGRHPAQLQAQQAAAATTPNFSSPAPMPPRSVPSPAAQRMQAGKSPFAASSQPATTTTAMIGATNMTPSMSQTNLGVGGSIGGASSRLFGSSPAGALTGFESPAALGLSLGQLVGIEDGVGMGISMSGISTLGLGGSSMGGRGDDEERRKRLEAVLEKLKIKNGRVSEEGIERLSRRCGLEALWEDRRKDGAKVLSIAGQTMLIDITFKSAEVEHVSLILPSSSSVVTSFAEPAGQILQADLQRPPCTPGVNYTLDKFAKNLERLTKLDRLSNEQINCFEALSGLYSSLRRLFDHEKGIVLKNIAANRPFREERAEREVLCKSSGRPNMHGHGAAGLSLDYWMKQRHVFQKRNTGEKTQQQHKEAKKEDFGNGENATENITSEINENSIYSLSIECEQCSPELYPPIRISDSWISNPLDLDMGELEIPAEQPFIEWLEPPPTYAQVNTGTQADAMVLDNPTIGTLPNVRFVAKLDPPITVPLQVAMQIMNELQASIPPESIQPTTMDELLLDAKSSPKNLDSSAVSSLNGDIKNIRSEKMVHVATEDGQEKEITHIYHLMISKPEYGRILEEIPFSHPRQLVQILPILRQYALLTSLLQTTMSDATSGYPSTAQLRPEQNSNNYQHEPHSSTSVSASDEDKQPQNLPVEIGLSSLPQNCYIATAFPLEHPSCSTTEHTQASPYLLKKHHSPIVYAGFQILPNGNVNATKQHLSAQSSKLFFSVPLDRNSSTNGATGAQNFKTYESTNKKLAKAIDICEDIGVWIEWIRGEKE